MKILKKLPNFVIDLIYSFTIFKPDTKEILQKAVDDWCENKNSAMNKYGHISIWNTSMITDMSFLFDFKKEFNNDISEWNVSNVINMSYMFHESPTFEKDIENWDVGVFSCAHSFNQPIEKWDVSNVKIMNCMFDSAYAFNQPIIKNWDVKNVTSKTNMFYCSHSFNQPINDWDIQMANILHRNTNE